MVPGEAARVLATVVSESSYLPAQRLAPIADEMKRKWRLQVAAAVNVVVDPDTPVDTVTFEAGRSWGGGIRRPLVNGVLQPHFLLNSLNSVLALVEHDPTRASAMLERMASFLLSGFDRLDEPLVRLHRELDTVRDYLKIEQVRFADRLRFTIEADGEAEQVSIPPFLLQATRRERCQTRYSAAPAPGRSARRGASSGRTRRSRR